MTERDGLDVQQAKIDQERFEQDQTNVIAGVRFVMSTVTGRAWMWDLLGRCRMLQSSVDLEAKNPTAKVFFLEGIRTVSTLLWDELQTHCIEGQMQMQREGQQIQATRNAVDERRLKKRRRRRRIKARTEDHDGTDEPGTDSDSDSGRDD